MTTIPVPPQKPTVAVAKVASIDYCYPKQVAEISVSEAKITDPKLVSKGWQKVITISCEDHRRVFVLVK